MRRHIAEHFNEPVDVGSSSLNEKGTIYGGEKNLRLAIDNIIKVYHPGLIGIVTTCLAETIGEDMERITGQYLRDRAMDNFPIVTASTPGYGGSHFEGYFFTLKRIIKVVNRCCPSTTFCKLASFESFGVTIIDPKKYSGSVCLFSYASTKSSNSFSTWSSIQV